MTVELQNAGGFRTHFEVQPVNYPAGSFMIRFFTTYDKSIKDPTREQDKMKLIITREGLLKMIEALEGSKC